MPSDAFDDMPEEFRDKAPIPPVQRGGTAHRHRLSRRAARSPGRHAAGRARVRRQHEGAGGSPGAARRDARAGGGPAVHPAAVLRLVDLHDRAGAGVGHRAVLQPLQPALDGALRRPHHRRGPGAAPGRARGHPRDGVGAEGRVLRGGAGQGLPGSGPSLRREPGQPQGAVALLRPGRGDGNAHLPPQHPARPPHQQPAQLPEGRPLLVRAPGGGR